MFSKELENLIQATLEDGVLEEYEKAALVKRAQKEGVDLTELEIYIQSILQRRKKELAKEEDAKQAEIDKKKQEALGPVCPKCHKQVPPMTLKCDCGYEFIKQNCSSAVQVLSEKIEKINSKPLPSDEDERNNELKSRNSQIIDLISVCPVPNTKEDIIEFLSLAATNSKFKGGLWGSVIGRIIILGVIAVVVFILGLIFGGKKYGFFIGATLVFMVAVYGGITLFNMDQETIRHNKRAGAWKTKFEQVLMKGRSLRGDPEFTRMLDYYENQMKMNEIESKKIFGIKLF